ncbi:MAG TPA: methyl-accepting chemotaxis protein, partial [Pirellulales bacterium]|nr:methyl-accepting chemotaxis protein [Pirellulales bacterium]
YTSDNLVPILPTEHDGKFVAETVPAFAAQTNLAHLQHTFPGFAYREAALNPTNPSNRAYDWEADIIRTFRDEPTLKEVVTERDTPTGRLLHLARPIDVRSPACLTCHSTPDKAPPSLTRTYGTTNGFGWKLHEIIGAQILSVPMAVPLKLAHDAYVTSLLILVMIFAVIFVVLNLLLHFLVIAPIGHVSAIAEAVSLGEENVESYVKPGKDEISKLSVAFNRMRESLTHAMALLK